MRARLHVGCRGWMPRSAACDARAFLSLASSPPSVTIQSSPPTHTPQHQQILRHAVIGMLPKNSMRHRVIKKLRVFPDDVHLYDQQLAGKKSII